MNVKKYDKLTSQLQFSLNKLRGEPPERERERNYLDQQISPHNICYKRFSENVEGKNKSSMHLIQKK